MKVKFGAIVTNGAGKLGGHQFQRGHTTGHLVTKRTGRKRKDRRPSRQNLLYKEACNSWQRESAQYKQDFTAAWDGNIEVPAKFGDVVALTGFQAYIMRYINYKFVGLTFDPSIFPATFSYTAKIRKGGLTLKKGGMNFELRIEEAYHHLKPIVYIKGWNQGATEPKEKEMKRAHDTFYTTDFEKIRFPLESNPAIVREVSKDYVKIKVQGIDEVGNRTLPDFATVEGPL